MSCLEDLESSMEQRVELPRGHDAAGIARRFLDAICGDRLDDLAYTNARLIISELVTNAFMHGTGRIFLRLEERDGTLRIEVVDEGSGAVPAIREQPENGVGGWGLRIVDTLSLQWGAFEGTTHVWAEIAA